MFGSAPCLLAPLAARAPPALCWPLRLRHLDHLNLSVTDLAQTRDWYARVFGFELVEEGVQDDGTPWAILRSGDAKADKLLYRAEQQEQAARVLVERFDIEPYSDFSAK